MAHKFDLQILDAMVNVRSMVQARRRVLGGKAPLNDLQRDEYHRLHLAEKAIVKQIREWQYWFIADRELRR